MKKPAVKLRAEHANRRLAEGLEPVALASMRSHDDRSFKDG